MGPLTLSAGKMILPKVNKLTNADSRPTVHNISNSKGLTIYIIKKRLKHNDLLSLLIVSLSAVCTVLITVTA